MTKNSIRRGTAGFLATVVVYLAVAIGAAEFCFRVAGLSHNLSQIIGLVAMGFFGPGISGEVRRRRRGRQL